MLTRYEEELEFEEDDIERILAESDASARDKGELSTVRECSASQEGGSTTTELFRPHFSAKKSSGIRSIATNDQLPRKYHN